MPETTWETDEVERWIMNDEYLYTGCRLESAEGIELQLKTMINARPSNDYLHSIDLNRVDWNYLQKELY